MAWSEGRIDEAQSPAKQFAEVYVSVTDPEVRLWLLRSCPSDRSLIPELMARETDVGLHEKLGKLLAK